jgi:peptidyl-Lys metalloendopeptidase
MRILSCLSLGLLAFLPISCMEAVAASLPLECRLEAVPPLRAGSPIVFRFHLTNRTAAPIWILAWNTPFEEWRGTILAVRFAGRELPYQGRMTKRGDPAVEEYLEIPAGDSKSALRDLAEAYDVSQPGLYTVEVVGGLQDVVRSGNPPHGRDRFQPMPLSCGTLRLAVEK